MLLNIFKSFLFVSLISISYAILILTYSFSNHGTFLKDILMGAVRALPRFLSKNGKLLPQLLQVLLRVQPSNVSLRWGLMSLDRAASSNATHLPQGSPWG